MEFWAGQLEQAQQQIAELENKITAQRQKLEQLRAQGLDIDLASRTLAVMEDSLARARLHVQHIENRIAAIAHEPTRQRRLAAARKSLASGQTRLG
jgi:septal ring factor EnvC (AmiA/AmiB activator)